MRRLLAISLCLVWPILASAQTECVYYDVGKAAGDYLIDSVGVSTYDSVSISNMYLPVHVVRDTSDTAVSNSQADAIIESLASTMADYGL